MKKSNRFIFLFMMLITTTTYGQVSKTVIGIELGAGARTLRYNEVIDTYNKTILGYAGAIVFQYNFNEMISLHTSAGYELKGTKTKAAIVDGNGNIVELADATRNLHYLTLPLLLRVTFTPKIKFFVNAGPYFGYLIKEKAKISSDQVPSDLDYSSHDKQFDWGTCFGAGAVFPINSRLGFSAEIRSNLGFMNLSKDKSLDGIVKNNTVNLLLGLVYNLSDITRDDDE